MGGGENSPYREYKDVNGTVLFLMEKGGDTLDHLLVNAKKHAATALAEMRAQLKVWYPNYWDDDGELVNWDNESMATMEPYAAERETKIAKLVSYASAYPEDYGMLLSYGHDKHKIRETLQSYTNDGLDNLLRMQ